MRRLAAFIAAFADVERDPDPYACIRPYPYSRRRPWPERLSRAWRAFWHDRAAIGIKIALLALALLLAGALESTGHEKPTPPAPEQPASGPPGSLEVHPCKECVPNQPAPTPRPAVSVAPVQVTVIQPMTIVPHVTTDSGPIPWQVIHGMPTVRPYSVGQPRPRRIIAKVHPPTSLESETPKRVVVKAKPRRVVRRRPTQPKMMLPFGR